MVQAYLIRGENGQWYAKYRKSDGKWTHHSLRTPNKATAQVRFGHFLKQLEERDLLFSEVRPLRLSEFAEEYLRHVKSHKSASWHRKQQYYIQGTILPFFGPDKDGGRWTTIHDSFNALVRRCDLQADPSFNITLHTLRYVVSLITDLLTWRKNLCNPRCLID